jgi:hypothetical protein
MPVVPATWKTENRKIASSRHQDNITKPHLKEKKKHKPDLIKLQNTKTKEYLKV